MVGRGVGAAVGIQGRTGSLRLAPARLSSLTITPRLARSPRGKLKLRGCFGWRRWCMRVMEWVEGGGGWRWRVVVVAAAHSGVEARWAVGVPHL